MLTLISPAEWVATFLIAVLLSWLCIVDIRSFRIPDAASLPLIGFGVLSSFWLEVTTTGASLLGASLGYGVFAALGAAYFAHREEEGLGLGDAKLLSAAGAWLGWRDLPILISIAALSALIFAGLTKRRRIAFGPWLAGAFFTIWMLRVSA